MALYKQEGSNIWFVDFSIKGKRIRRSTGTESKQAAQQFHDTLKAELWKKKNLDELPDHTWDEAVTRFLKEKADKRSLEHDKAMLRWSSPYLKGKKLSEIDADMIDALIEERRKGHTKRTKDGVSNATINRHMEAVYRILNIAVEWKWLEKAPKNRKLKEPKKRLRWLTKEEITRLLKEVPEHMGDMVKFSLATGLRESNVLDLEWSQVDMERKVAWIHHDQFKTERNFSIPLNDAALAVLQARKGVHPQYVFTYQGKKLKLATTAAWYRALKRADLEDFNWHGLRHTWASHHVMNGTPLAVLKDLGGWASLEMVMRYAHLAPSHVAQYSGNAPSTA